MSSKGDPCEFNMKFPAGGSLFRFAFVIGQIKSTETIRFQCCQKLLEIGSSSLYLNTLM